MNDESSPNITRRGAIKAGAGMTLGGILSTSDEPAASAAEKKTLIYEALGLKRIINAAGTFTALGGSVMPPEVVAAWVEASKHFVDLPELQDKVGAKIAQLIGVEAALVTTGAAGALLLGTAAVVTRPTGNLTEADCIKRLPDTTGMKNEVILQKSHHSCYDNQLTDVGVRLIDVETVADVEGAINPRTALMFFMNISDGDGKIRRADWVKLAQKYQIPTLLDAAADAPPLSRLTEYLKMGFDLVAFSGGKAIRGPNDTGLLLGGKELIARAKKNANPNCGTIGRMMKVSKEDMVALLAAVDRFVHLDHDAELREWDRRIEAIQKALRDIPTIQMERIVPEIANRVPHLLITWDEKKLNLTPEQLAKELADGDSSIRTGRVHGTGNKGLLISVFVLADGEERIVAERIHGIFKAHI
jgi:L-seryl-tRNA(Ser) seleniumtransferase